jgi:hypothetical protein
MTESMDNSPRTLCAPMFAMARTATGERKQIGGPFSDIDGVLDACWDHMAEHDAPAESVYFLESVGGCLLERQFPKGALPDGDEESAE